MKKSEIKRIALLGIHAEENFRDWYTGTSSYNVTILDAFKNLLPDTEILYDDCRDTIAIKSILTGKYLRVNDDGTVSADGEICDESCRFIKSDWGGEIILTSVKNGKYITENGVYTADTDSLFLWFVKQALRPSIFNGCVIYKSWNNKPVFIDKDGFLKVGESPRVELDQMFIEEIVYDGIMRGNKLARICDCAVICVGNHPMLVAREEHDRNRIELPNFQKELVKAVHAANDNTIMCIVSSYPYAIPELDKQLPAILYTSHGGAEMGNAVAETILGINNPAGRTPMTWYESTDELPQITDYDIIKNKSTYLYYDHKPLYPFGYGLSYSKFIYSDLAVRDKPDSIEVSVTVENVSETSGDEVVQIYLSELESRYKRPLKQLCGFKRGFIEAGNKKIFDFTIEKREFGRWDVANHDYSFDEGNYFIYAGGSSADDKCGVKIFLTGRKRTERNMFTKTLAVDYDDKRCIEIKTTSDAKHEYVAGTELFDGSITFYDCNFDNCNSIKIKASTSGNEARISFRLDGEKGEQICSLMLPCFVEPENFKSFEIPLDKTINGTHDLVVLLNNRVNLYEIKMK